MKILWIGLGRFGAPMAQNLLDSSQALLLRHSAHAQAATNDLLGRGATVFGIGSAAEVCGICVPTPQDVEDSLTGIDATNCPLVVDFSTGHPEGSRRLARTLAQRGVQYLDAPVSGSLEAARTGNLTVWIGANQDQCVVHAKKLLDLVASNIYYMGGLGSGAAMKLTNQIIHISTMAAIGEGLAFANVHGLDLETAVESMLTSSADSAMLRRFGPSIARGDFTAKFALRLALKDLRFAEYEAELKSLNLTTLSALRRRLEKLSEKGFGETDFSILADPNRLYSNDET